MICNEVKEVLGRCRTKELLIDSEIPGGEAAEEDLAQGWIGEERCAYRGNRHLGR